MKLIFYITQFNQVKDATKFYLETLSKAFTGTSTLKMTKNVNEVKDVDYAITFTVTDFLKLKLKKPHIKVIHWFQGIIPEEAKLKTNSKKQYFAFSLLEWFTLKFSTFNFFVSAEMKNHYTKKYGYKKKNHFIMPCFNGVLQKETAFLKKNYQSPSFIYIGSMAAWQCVDKVLEVFKEVQKTLPDASLTLLTAQHEIAAQKCKDHQVKANIDYVPLAQINEALLQYKYGFLLREDIEVNRVATPTKMSTYLANGVLPIYSDVIKDFKVVDKLNFKIKAKQNNPKVIAQQIIAFEKRELKNSEVYKDFKQLFSTYYNQEKYIAEISKMFKKE